MLGSTAVCGLGNFSDICTAKFGLVGLMESVDHELTLGGYDGIYTTSAVSHYLSTHLYQLAKTRFNPIVPPLTLDYASKKIMHAILVCSFYSSFQFIHILFRSIENLFAYHVFYYLVPFVKGILPSRAFLILLNTLINPKIPIYIREDSNGIASRSGSLSPTQHGNHIQRKRSHASACE